MCVNVYKLQIGYKNKKCNKVALVDHIYTVLRVRSNSSQSSENAPNERNREKRHRKKSQNNTPKMPHVFPSSSQSLCVCAFWTNHNVVCVVSFVRHRQNYQTMSLATCYMKLKCNIISQCSNKCAKLNEEKRHHTHHCTQYYTRVSRQTHVI